MLNLRNPEDLINADLSPVRMDDSEQRRPEDVISIINSAFNNRLFVREG